MRVTRSKLINQGGVGLVVEALVALRQSVHLMLLCRAFKVLELRLNPAQDSLLQLVRSLCESCVHHHLRPRIRIEVVQVLFEHLTMLLLKRLKALLVLTSGLSGLAAHLHRFLKLSISLAELAYQLLNPLLCSGRNLLNGL